jgi:deoxyadenosine/deoxycytidine kinase
MSAYQTKPVIISVEGNIGSGKTTILEHLQTTLQGDNTILFLREPLDVWERVKDEQTGETILEKFYANPDQYAFPFQVMAYATRLSMIRQTMRSHPRCKAIVCERSLTADKEIFAKMLHDDGKIDSVCYQIYQQFYKEFSDEIGLDGIVYIDADANVCKERVILRSRQGENGISIEYLSKCKSYHDEWLTNDPVVCRIKTNSHVTYDPNDPNDLGHEWLKEIKHYIYKVIESQP